MPKLIVSIDGIVVREVQLIKDRTTMGRRPYNDVVIDNLAVSGEHAVITMSGSEVVLEDLNSTNGTHVNGKAVKRQVLQNDDTIEVGKYRVKYVTDTATQAPQNFDRTMVIKAGALSAGAGAGGGATGRIKVMSGPAAGREVPLVKPATTVGKPRRGGGVHQQAGRWLCAAACGGQLARACERPAHRQRGAAPEQRRHHRTGRNADAVSAGLINCNKKCSCGPHRRPLSRYKSSCRVAA